MCERGEWRTHTARVRGQTYQFSNLNPIQCERPVATEQQLKIWGDGIGEVVVLREASAVRVRSSGTNSPSPFVVTQGNPDYSSGSGMGVLVSELLPHPRDFDQFDLDQSIPRTE